MIDGRPRSATVTVVETMKAALDPRTRASSRSSTRTPAFARHLLKTLCARLREAEARPSAG